MTERKIVVDPTKIPADPELTQKFYQNLSELIGLSMPRRIPVRVISDEPETRREQ